MTVMWFRVVSDGAGSERYTLQVPIQLGPTYEVKAGDVTTVTVGGHRMELSEFHGAHSLRIAGFKSPADAEAFFPRLRGSLLRLIVRGKFSLMSARMMQQVRFQDPPVEVDEKSMVGRIVTPRGWTHIDGFVDPTPAVVVPEHLRVIEAGAGSVSVTISMLMSSFLEQVAEGLMLPRPQGVAQDERLSLSIELYAASLCEISPRTRVVSLVTALEALVAPGNVSQDASDAIDRCIKTFDLERDPPNEDESQSRALDRMRSRLENLKEESISEMLRELVAVHAAVLDEGPDVARRNVVRAYKVRSSLVHEGKAPEDEVLFAEAWLGRAVPAMLKSLVDLVSRLA